MLTSVSPTFMPVECVNFFTLFGLALLDGAVLQVDCALIAIVANMVAVNLEPMRKYFGGFHCVFGV